MIKGKHLVDEIARELSQMFFKKKVSADIGQVTMNSDMIRVLTVIHEDKDMAQVAKELGMNPLPLRETLARLLELGIIEPIRKTIQILDSGFMATLRALFSQEVGPVADFVIEDKIAEMGLIESRVPVHRAKELINHLAGEIPERDRRVIFQQSMIEIIPK
jgi:hypothetical protein